MCHKKRFCVHIAPSALILLALFLLVSSPLLLLALLGAAVCHELGHCAALYLLHCRITALHITALGAEMQVAGRLSYGGELLAAAAVPAANLLLSLPLAFCGRWWESGYLFAGAQLILGLFNLLPIAPLDGGSLLWNLLAWITHPYLADCVVRIVSLSGAIVLAAAALWGLYLGGSPFLLLAALGLLRCTLKQMGLAKAYKSG